MTTPAKRIVGIDPGSLKTGWGVIEQKGSRLKYLGAGVIRTRPQDALADRLLQIEAGLEAVFEETGACTVAIEEVFVSKNARSALILGHARGAALLTAAKTGRLVHAYPATIIKRALVGSGRADKTQVAHVVQAILKLKKLPGRDATDALAIAITHAQTMHLIT